jgi:hypothetical protein
MKQYYERNKSSLRQISKTEFDSLFVEIKDVDKLKRAYEKAWDSKKFEIENYWKRAAYFWAFQVASFAVILQLLKIELVHTNLFRYILL